MSATLLEVRDLTVDYPTDAGLVRVVDGIDLTVGRGERVAIVGESGSGKSVACRALLRLDPESIIGGSVRFDGKSVLDMSKRELTAYRGSSVGMVFQDPFGSLDPGMRIGDQVSESLRLQGVSKQEAEARALRTLEELGVPRAADRMRAYPHELSGGLRQRVSLAMGLVAEPQLLIADEVTTALDTRVQRQVLDLMYLAFRARAMSVVLISHDLGVVASFAERVVIVYAGRIVEEGPIDEIFAAPRHPYTQGLLAAVPRIDAGDRPLVAIPGSPPTPARRPSGCAFHPRCPQRFDRCETAIPALVGVGQGRRVACHLHDGQG